MIGIIKRLSVSVPGKAFLTIYKSSIRPHLDYGDILYDKPGNQDFQNKLETVQYKACLAITGAIQGTSRQKIYDELGLHALIERRCRSKLTFFYKIANGLLPKYLCLYLKFPSQENYPLRSALTTKINPIPSRSKTFRKTFFLYCINEWNNLKPEVRNPKQIGVFKKVIITEKKENPLFSTHNPFGVKLLTRLRLQLSHLNEHKFRHGFEDTISPMCSCNAEIESNKHFLLRCHFYSSQRFELFDKCNKINLSFFKLSANDQVNILLYGYSSKKTISLNEDIKLEINFLIESGRFDRPWISFNQ